MDVIDEASNEPAQSGSVIADLVRFCRIVAARKKILILSLLVAGLVGGVYYVLAQRSYESRAEVLVLQTGGNVMDANSSNQRSVLEQIPTYEKVLSSAAVLEGAIKSLPARHRIDLAGSSKERWVEALRSRVGVSSTRQTNIISLTFRSSDPQTSAVVVGAILDSYLKFMDQTHRSSSREVLEVLTREKTDLEQRLQEKEGELIQLKSSSGVLLTGGDRNTHVLIERTVKLNDALVEAQKKSLESKAFLVAVEEAVRTGADIQQFVLQTADAVAKEVFLKEMGLGTQDGYTMARFEQQLSDDRSELTRRRLQYGSAHPLVVELRDRIQGTEEWLVNRQLAVAERMRQIRTQELGPRLVEMARQRFHQSTAHEAALRQQFEQENAVAEHECARRGSGDSGARSEADAVVLRSGPGTDEGHRSRI